ncbi:hypothetical protein RB195_014068 [Necator americanus]|uniref:Uncharacterized protein n=1 Tax=Necator americanus TaxID=51031 RepID=A0ABR1DYG8_NECAM
MVIMKDAKHMRQATARENAQKLRCTSTRARHVSEKDLCLVKHLVPRGKGDDKGLWYMEGIRYKQHILFREQTKKEEGVGVIEQLEGN